MRASSSHGIPKIARSERLIFKIMWTICVLVSIMGCLFFFVTSTIDYLKFDFFTKIQVTKEASLELPALTICPYPQHKRINIENMLFYCNFNGTYNCTNDFEVIKIPFDLGGSIQCLKFNGGKDRDGRPIQVYKATRSGYSCSLNLGLYSSQINNVYYRIEENFVQPLATDVVSKHMHKNVVTFLKLSKLVERKLGKPFSDCTEDLDSTDTPLYRATMKHNTIYRKKSCYALCIQKAIADKCKCTYSTEQVMQKQCGKNNCTLRAYSGFDFEKECSGQCPEECDSTSFLVNEQLFPNFVRDSTETPYMHKIAERYNVTGLDEEEINKNIFWMRVFYEELTSKETSQIAKTSFTNLVSNFGGIVGAFLGLSVLSLFEILEYFLEITLLLAEHLRKKQIKQLNF